MALHKIFSKSATAERGRDSSLTTGIKALVARYRQEYQDARGGLQKGSLITPDDSGRQNAIRVYIFGESGIVGVYFRLVTHGI
jgi:hypothetical protein